MTRRLIPVYVENRWVRFDCSEEELEPLQPYWSFAHPKWHFIKKKYSRKWYNAETKEWETIYWWDGMIRYLKDGYLPSGLFWATKRDIETEQGVKFQIRAKLRAPEWKRKEVVRSKREYQNTCIERMRAAARFGGGLVLSATGTGKTYIAAMLFSELAGETVFVVDQLTLLKQAQKELEQVLGERVGMIGDSIFDPRRVTVATVQTLYLHKDDERFAEWQGSLQVMIIDEIHEQMNNRNFGVVEKIMPRTVFGLTATLQLKKKAIRTKAWALAGPVVFEFPLKEGQERGVLTKGIAVRVKIENEITKREQKEIGWASLYQSEVVENERRNYVIEQIVREADRRGKYTIVLVTRLRHLEVLSERLSDVPHRIVAGTVKGKSMRVEERMVAKDRFEEGDIRLLLANVVFKKGINIRRVDVIVDGAAGKNANDPVQKYGRGVRLHRSKAGLLYFDVNDTDTDNKRNFFWVSSQVRARALKRAGIRVELFQWGVDGGRRRLFDKAEVWLKRELECEQ